MEAERFDSDFPSKITEEYWVYTSGPNHESRSTGSKQIRSGKWLVFADVEGQDEIWQRIKRATKEGLLGLAAKAATAKLNPNSISEKERVICVYTYNWLDVVDVYRVEKALREIGIQQTLYYKADIDTLNRKYKASGSKSISKYVSKATKSYDKHDLASLHGIGPDKVHILHGVGIKTLDDLLSFDTSQKLVGCGISTERINKLKLSALSQIENKIYRLTSTEWPQGEVVHFDIETDLTSLWATKQIWNISVLYNKQFKRFFAETWKQERTILEAFLKYIKNIDNPNLVSYSGAGFDKGILGSALKRHNLDHDYFLNCNHYDLCTHIRQNYVLPIGGYRLKVVGQFFGYEFRHGHLDGWSVAMQYLDCQRTGDKLPKYIVDYVEDDVKSMDYIVEQLKTRTDIIHLHDHN